MNFSHHYFIVHSYFDGSFSFWVFFSEDIPVDETTIPPLAILERGELNRDKDDNRIIAAVKTVVRSHFLFDDLYDHFNVVSMLPFGQSVNRYFVRASVDCTRPTIKRKRKIAALS